MFFRARSHGQKANLDICNVRASGVVKCMSTEVRTRFAPSPTGFLHLGGARTALFNWLFAKKHQGTFVLRVEDTDEERNTEQAFQAIYDGMDWMGISWDEGYNKGGEYGPYSQSERTDIYLKWFEKLVAADRVYQDGETWRFRFERKNVTVKDLVCGDITIDYANEEINPDMTVRRPDGSFTFHFVNVVDDIEMKISHVIRGEDHLMNTPKHIQLYEAFGVEPPIFAHIPLILNDSGKKMSKRDEGAAVKDYIKMGLLPEAALNFIALLGWNPKTEQEIFSSEELVEKFDLSQINRAPARFDLQKALWMNQQYLMSLEPESFLEKALPYLKEDGLPAESPILSEVVKAVQEKVSSLNEVAPAISFFFNDAYTYNEGAVAKALKNAETLNLLSALKDTWSTAESWENAKDLISETAKAQGTKAGKLMFPTRVALSGLGGGIDLGVIISALGKQQCVARLERFIASQQG